MSPAASGRASEPNSIESHAYTRTGRPLPVGKSDVMCCINDTLGRSA